MRDLSVLMEVVAVLLPPLVLLGVVALVAAMAVTRMPALLGSAASWAVFGIVAVFLPWVPHSTGHVSGGVTIAVANVFAGNPTKPEAAADVLAADADIVVVPEDNDAVHEVLAAKYPFAHRADSPNPWVGVYAKVPVTETPADPTLYDPGRYVRLEVGGPTPFVLWALHLPRPWITSSGSFQMSPGAHARVLDRFLDAIGAETKPVVVAGDLNLTDRGRGYRKFTAHLDDAMRGTRGARSEIRRRFRPLLLSIDHILEPPDWCAEGARRFRIRGSDHRGITARVGPCL